MFERAFESIALTFCSVLMIVVTIAVLVYLPLTLTTEARCLKSGYPKSSVTWDFERYCMNLEGTVTVEVERL